MNDDTTTTIPSSIITSNLTSLLEHLTQPAVSALENTNAGQLMEQISQIPIHSFFYPPYFLPFYFPYGPYNVWLHRRQLPIHYPMVIPELKSLDEYRPFPSSDSLTEEDALKELKIIKQQHQDSLSRIFPSITISSDYSGITLTYKTFVSLVNKIRSSVTVYVTTTATNSATK